MVAAAGVETVSDIAVVIDATVLDAVLGTGMVMASVSVVTSVDSVTAVPDKGGTGVVAALAVVAAAVALVVVPGSAAAAVVVAVSVRMQSDCRADESLAASPIEFKNNRPFRRTT